MLSLDVGRKIHTQRNELCSGLLHVQAAAFEKSILLNSKQARACLMSGCIFVFAFVTSKTLQILCFASMESGG
jgi:hypothetical protein